MKRRRERTFRVFGFRTTHEALEAENAICGAGIRVVPIPAPREIGARCGLAMRVSVRDEDAAVEALERCRIEPQRVATIRDF